MSNLQAPFKPFNLWHDPLYKCYFTKSLTNQSASPRSTSLVVAACCIILDSQIYCD